MHTPTLDHQQGPPKGACQCTAYVLCARCYGLLQRERAEEDLRRWIAAFGTLPDPRAPKRSQG